MERRNAANKWTVLFGIVYLNYGNYFEVFRWTKLEKKRNEIIHGKNTLIISPVFETEKPSAQFFITQKGHISRNFEF